MRERGKMGSKRSSSCVMFLYVCVVWVCVLSSSASEEREVSRGKRHNSDEHHNFHTIELNSLFPSASCNPSPKEGKTKPSLRVVHSHGACSHLRIGGVLDPTEVLKRDQARVDSIHSMLSRTSTIHKTQRDSTELPAKAGVTIGSPNYIVTIGIGTPKKDLSLTFDTGSDLIWTQCEPCLGSCYPQKEPKFNPSLSSSYSNVSCSAAPCAALSKSGIARNCSSTTCIYGTQYGDNSFTAGFLAREKITLTTSDAFDGVYFGCGQYNGGLFSGAAGLLGLGRGQLAFASQTESIYNKIFSYCLPSSASSTGHLTFGPAAVSGSVKFTPLSTNTRHPTFYSIDILAISVGGQQLAIPSSVFSTAGAIIDSGTVITRLPPQAYAALRSSFQAAMSDYRRAPATGILDTCYDFSNSDSVTIPRIGFFFGGGVEVELDVSGVFFVFGRSQVCLAFAATNDDTKVAIFGNVQQRTLDVVYDGAGGRVGFAPGGCK